MASVLTTAALLDAWERALTEPPIQRALGLLAIAHPETPREHLKQLPIGQRDSLLMEIREALFGPQLTCLTACPGCGERLEIALDLRQMRAQPALASPATPAETHSLAVGSCQAWFRLPNSADMLALAGLPDANSARQTLLELCLQRATRDEAPLSAAELPDELVSGIAGRMAQLDPQADIQIALTCPACARQWSTAFDIVSYLWSEINTWAIRILREVHQLARAYGWREADILALSPLRRQFYLDLIG